MLDQLARIGVPELVTRHLPARLSRLSLWRSKATQLLWESLACWLHRDVFIGGKFDSAGGVKANAIADWNLSSGWSALSTGLAGCHTPFCDGPTVFTLAAVGDNIYVGGDFASAGGITVNDIAKRTIHAIGRIGRQSYCLLGHPQSDVG